MALIQKELKEQQTMPSYIELDGQLNKKLDKLERGVISTKKDKHTRDQLDYYKNNVYIWKKPVFRSTPSPKGGLQEMSQLLGYRRYVGL